MRMKYCTSSTLSIGAGLYSFFVVSSMLFYSITTFIWRNYLTRITRKVALLRGTVRPRSSISIMNRILMFIVFRLSQPCTNCQSGNMVWLTRRIMWMGSSLRQLFGRGHKWTVILFLFLPWVSSRHSFTSFIFEHSFVSLPITSYFIVPPVCIWRLLVIITYRYGWSQTVHCSWPGTL